MKPLRKALREKAIKRRIAEIASEAQGKKILGQIARELGLAGCFSGPRNLAERHDHYLRLALRGKRARGHR